MDPRRKEQLGGVVLVLGGLCLTYLSWSSASSHFLLKAAGFGPGVVLIGLALLVIPSYRRERELRGEDIRTLTGSQLITRRWWVVLILALALGALNVYLVGFLPVVAAERLSW